MKKHIILSGAILFFTLSSIAQIMPSSHFVGGSSSFTIVARPSNNYLRTTFSVQPECGKFLSEKWSIGGGLGYVIDDSRTSQSDQKLRNRFQSFGGNFALSRYYPLTEKFYFTMEYGFGVNYTLSQMGMLNGSSDTSDNFKGIGFTIGASPGLAYFVNDKWMLFARMGQLSYGYSKTVDFDIDNALHVFGYNFQGNSFGLGARFILGTGK